MKLWGFSIFRRFHLYSAYLVSARFQSETLSLSLSLKMCGLRNFFRKIHFGVHIQFARLVSFPTVGDGLFG